MIKRDDFTKMLDEIAEVVKRDPSQLFKPKSDFRNKLHEFRTWQNEYTKRKMCSFCQKKLKLKDLGYSCKDLESQKIKNIHTISEPKTEIGKLSQEERYIKTLTNRISKKIIIANSLSDDKAKKVIKWVNKELVKWSKDDDDEINTVGGRKEKMQSLTKKGIKKFK